MKTNQIMIRRMGSFRVEQRTSDGYFNATVLLRQWNEGTGSHKEIKEFIRNNQTQAFIQVLKNEEYPNGENSPYLANRGNKGASWMHPFLFIKFSMWINPRFEYQVIKFVYDQLIQFRHSAGDNYRNLSVTATQLKNVDYSLIAKGLNYIIFGKHEKGLRQSATPEQLQDLTNLENQLAFAIDMKYIKTFEQLIDEMRKMYLLKWKKALAA